VEIDSEEHEEPRYVDPSFLDTHPSNVKREEPIDLVEPIDPIDRPRDVVVAKRRPAWLHDTL
jgi:hypothetical protein